MNASTSFSQPRSASQPSVDDLDAAICKLAQQINGDTYRLLMLVRDFDDRMGWARWSFRNCSEWLAWRCGLSLSAAREKVRTAQALRALPLVAQAFAAGRLSYSKVRAVTRVAAEHDEGSLLDYALQATAAQVEERCRELRNANPDSVAGALRAWQRRSLTLWRNDARGVVTISVELPVEQGELVAKALERAVAAGEVAMGIEFAADSCADEVRDGESTCVEGNGWRAQHADALVAIARSYLSGGSAADGAPSRKPAATADHYQVVVHVDASALRGGVGRSDLPIDTVKRLTCDGSLITIVEDENGTALDAGRKRRTITTALRRALWARDRGCTFPGCGRKRYVDGHHIKHWAEGGETRPDNITLLCWHHHTLLHEGRFRIRRNADGSLRFERYDGRVIPRFGYRLEDMQDDYEAPPNALWNPSAEGCNAECGDQRSPDERCFVAEPTAATYRASTNPSLLALRNVQIRDRSGRGFGRERDRLR